MVTVIAVVITACICSKLSVTVAVRCRPSQYQIENQQDIVVVPPLITR